jgi:hypothetical protein
MLWLTIALGVLLLLFFALYRRSLSESQALSNYALLILLDDQVRDAQRKGLRDFVRSTDAKNALELGAKVNLSVAQLAHRLNDTMLGTNGMLWQLRTAAGESK